MRYDSGERVTLERWPASRQLQCHTHLGGEEIYVMSGELIDEHGRYPAGTWIRNPRSSSHRAGVESDTVLWVKTGHLD